MTDFSSRLNYSFGNEDSQTEQKALQVKPDSRILCITASGDRPLNLLQEDCKHITSVDANPLQNNLLRLKIAAIQELEFEDYLRFIGASRCKERISTFPKIAPQLCPESALFWNGNQKLIQKGVIYQGRIERITKIVALLCKIMRPLTNNRLFEFNDLEEQKKFVRDKWDSYTLRKCIEIALSTRVSSFFDIDPGVYSHVGPSIRVGSYVYDCIINMLQNRLAKESVLLSLIFLGKVHEVAYPPYLKRDSFENIKQRLPKLSIVTHNVLNYMEEAQPNSFDRFSMSDIASYMPQEAFNRMIKAIYRTAKPGARFCIRQFSSDHEFPSEFISGFKREPKLEKELEREDHCFLYRFMVGKVVK